MKKLQERFDEKWELDPQSGCWVWTSSLGNKGYGEFWIYGRHQLAHRISWMLHKGSIPTHNSYHGMCVLHKCDNPPCVNPDHLFLGTHLDNTRDRDKKGRQPSKLNPRQVLAIRDDPRMKKDIAADYSVSRTLISMIKNRKRWGWL